MLVETKELVKNLKNLSTVTKKTKMYPALEYAKIYAKNDEFIMEATNLDFLLRVRMHAEFSQDNNFDVAVHPKKLLDLLAATKEEYVILEPKDFSLTVKKESGVLIGTISVSVEEFPSFPEEINHIHKTTVFEGDAEKFIAGMAAVLPSAAKDDYNKTLNSVRLSVFGSDKSEIENPESESGWEWMATDAITGSVCRARNPISGESMDVLIPIESASVLGKILAKNQDDISLGTYCVDTKPWLFGRAGNIEFGCQLTFGQFPPLKKVFENPSVPWFSTNGKEFATVLKSKSKEGKINLESQGGLLYIAGDDGNTSMVAVEENTSENRIFLNPKKLLDLVNHKKINVKVNSHRGMVFIDVPSHPAGDLISIIMEIKK